MSPRKIQTAADLTGLEREGLAYMVAEGFVSPAQATFSTELYDFVEQRAKAAGLSQDRVNVILRASRDVGNVFGGAIEDQAGNDGLARTRFLSESEDAVLDGAVGAGLLDTAKALEGRLQ